MGKVLNKNFFERPTLEVAEGLLGKYIVRQIGNQAMALKIIEVEAYDGFKDKASHAHRGETPRNKVMFGEAGYWYVYLCYGMHYMLNIVTGPKGYPAAVLIRGVEGIAGPGRVTKQLFIDKNFNGKKSAEDSSLWIEDRGEAKSKIKNKKVKTKIKYKIQKTPRVGVGYAGRVWAKKPYRFLLVDKK